MALGDTNPLLRFARGLTNLIVIINPGLTRHHASQTWLCHYICVPPVGLVLSHDASLRPTKSLARA